MTVTETLNEGLKRAYSLVIEAQTIARKVEDAIVDIAPKIRMPGFRPGKVPANLIRKMHGEALRQEAVNEAINEAVNGMLSDRGLRPAMQPQIDLDSGTTEGEDVKISVALEILPEVPEYSVDGLTLEKLVVDVSDAELDTALQRLAEQQKSFDDAPEGHAAANGDQVVMDYVGSIDGVEFEGGKGEDMAIELGSGRLIPGFEDQLAGAKVGDDKTVKLTFPEDYGAEALAGKDAEFAVTVKAVKLASSPAIDDALATNLGLESLEQLRGLLKDQVEAELANLSRTYLKRKLLDHLAAAHDFGVPPSMVDAEFEQIWAQVIQDASDADKEKLESERGDYARIAERRVRLGLLLSDIGQKNNITVTQQEMNRLIAQEASRYPGQQEQVQQYFAQNNMAAAQLRAPLYEEKVVDFLLGKAEVTERTVTREELEAAIADEDETPHGEKGHVHGPDCNHDHDHDGEKAEAAAKPAAKRKAPARKEAETAEATDAADAKPVRKPTTRKPKAAETASDDVGSEAAAPETEKPARKPRAKKAASE